MDFAEELRVCLQEVVKHGTIEIRENGGRMTAASPLCWEVRGASAKPLLHLWAENCNVTRRVLAITDKSEGQISLAVERFGKNKPERMEIVRRDFARSKKSLSRLDFGEQLRRILAEQFPDETVEKLSVAADLEHSLSGVYVRGISRRGPAQIAFLAVADDELQDAVENSLSHALLWLDRARQAVNRARHLSGLRLILPKGSAAFLATRLSALTSSLAIEVYERDSSLETLQRVDPAGNGNFNSWLVPLRETQALLDRARAMIEPIVKMAPEAIRAHAIAQSGEVLLRFYGLTFARWDEGRVFFDSAGAWRELLTGTESEFQKALLRLKNYRHPLATETRHALYRARPEGWMQEVVRKDASRIELTLDPGNIYEQVFAHSGGQNGVLDLLGVTRTGRLAILELKANENLQLPLQAADYWIRIRQHLAQGDLQRYGYFPGIALQSAPPIVYLIAPALRFHSSTETLLRYLNPGMEVVRVGLAESWRRGVRVVMRQ